MDDILRDFVVETSENIDMVDAELVRFEQEPNNGEIVAQIFRLVHTVKGTCGFLGLPRLATLAHAAETVISMFRDGVPVTTDAVTLILETIDRIKLIIAEIDKHQAEPEGDDDDLISRLEYVAAVNAAAADEAKASAIAAKDAESKPAAPAAPANDDPTAGTLIYQVLERPLKPGEVSLDDLERAFREAEGPAEEETPSWSDAIAEMAAPAPQEPAPVVPIREAKPAPAAVHAEAPAAKPAKSAVSATSPASEPIEGEKQGGGVSGLDLKRNTIRVAVDTLEHLMTMVSELVLTRNQLLEISRRGTTPEYNVPLQRLSQVTGELQDGVMKTRMQPIGNAWATLPRLVRDLCTELGKEIDLEAEGADTEIDRQLLELIKDPITHMIRNSADHGIERPDERIAAGKPRRGRISISAAQEGGYIKLQIADNGRGLNIARIREKAIGLGLATEAELDRMSEQQIGRFIFHAGFSTAEKVTNVSGRGVGMDVVRANIELAGGTTDVRTVRGRGTAMIIKIPLTLAIAAALIITCSEQRFAIPQLAVVEIVRPRSGSDARIESLNGANVLRLREKLLPVSDLDALLNLSNGEGRPIEDKFIVICQFDNHLFGLAVDSVLQTEEIVVKPVSVRLRDLPTYSGTTILGDGSVIMILDPNGIGGMIGALTQSSGQNMAGEHQNHRDLAEAKTSLLVFRAGTENFKAVPLGLVTRLEEIDVTKIETGDGQLLVQYRGHLIPLVPANHNVMLRGEGAQPILVFSRSGKTAGLIVDEIVDIVEDHMQIDQAGLSHGCLGSAIIRGKATDIIDVSAVLPFVATDEAQSQKAKIEGPPSVLLVESDDFFRALLAPVLKAAGFRVFVVEKGEDALNFLANRHCDIVVTDLEMVGVSGFDLTAQLRSDPRFGAVRIVGLSTDSGPRTINRAREVGFDDLVGKFDRQGLVASLLDLTATEEKAA